MSFNLSKERAEILSDCIVCAIRESKDSTADRSSIQVSAVAVELHQTWEVEVPES